MGQAKTWTVEKENGVFVFFYGYDQEGIPPL